MLTYINVHDVFIIDPPSQCEVVYSTRGRSKDKLSIFKVFEHFDCTFGIDVLEFRVINSPLLISTLLLIRVVNLESGIDKVCIRNLKVLVHIVGMRLEVFPFTVEGHTEFIFLLILYLVYPASDNMAHLYKIFDPPITCAVKIRSFNLCLKTIVQLTDSEATC